MDFILSMSSFTTTDIIIWSTDKHSILLNFHGLATIFKIFRDISSFLRHAYKFSQFTKIHK